MIQLKKNKDEWNEFKQQFSKENQKKYGIWKEFELALKDLMNAHGIRIDNIEYDHDRNYNVNPWSDDLDTYPTQSTYNNPQAPIIDESTLAPEDYILIHSEQHISHSTNSVIVPLVNRKTSCV